MLTSESSVGCSFYFSELGFKSIARCQKDRANNTCGDGIGYFADRSISNE